MNETMNPFYSRSSFLEPLLGGKDEIYVFFFFNKLDRQIKTLLLSLPFSLLYSHVSRLFIKNDALVLRYPV